MSDVIRVLLIEDDEDDYDELVSEIANLTDQIKELNEQIDVLSGDLQSLE